MPARKNDQRHRADDASRGIFATYFPFTAALWTLLLLYLFHQGGYLGNRAPSVGHLAGMFDLLLRTPAILANGLATNLFKLAVIAVAFWTIGRSLFREPAAVGLPRLEVSLYRLTLGAGTAALTILSLGMIGRLNGRLLVSLVYSIAIAGVAFVVRARNPANAGRSHASTPDVPALKPLVPILATLIALTAALCLAASAGPETFFDSLVYHLALPKLYLLHERLISTPHNLYSGFPMVVEMLYALCLSMGDESLAILLHFAFGIAAAAALACWLSRRASASVVAACICLFALSPTAYSCAWVSGTDLGTTFFSAMAFLALTRALDASDDASRKRLTLMGAASIGFALGCKYTAVYACAPLVIFSALLDLKSGRGLSRTGVILIAATLVFTPWALKNASFYGNPVYPFLSTFFGNAYPAEWERFLSDAHSKSAYDALTTIRGLKGLLLAPWNSVTSIYGLYRVNLTYLILIPVAVAAWLFDRRNLEDDQASAYAVLSAVAGLCAWALTTDIPRFLLPTLLIFAAFASYVFITDSLPPWTKSLLALALIWTGLGNLSILYTDGVPERTDRWRVATGETKRADFLMTARHGYGQPYYAAAKFVNDELPRTARLAMIGEPRGYYFNRQVVASSPFDANPFWLAVEASSAPEELYALLRGQGITHLFLNAFQLYAFRDNPAILPRPIASLPHLREFWSTHLHKVFEKHELDSLGRIKDWLIVYELAPKRPVSTQSEFPIPIVLASP